MPSSRYAPGRTKQIAAAHLQNGDLLPLIIPNTPADSPPRWAVVRSVEEGLGEHIRIVRLYSETRGGRVVDLCDLRLPPGCERVGCQNFTAPRDLLIEADITDRQEVF